MAETFSKYFNLKKLKKKKFLGFTLIELMIVISIVSVITAVGATSFVGTTKTARDSRRKTDVETVRQALELYKADHSEYPDISGDLGLLQSFLAAYIKADQFPTDPGDEFGYYYARDVASARKYQVCAYLEKSVSAAYTGTVCGTAECNYCVESP